MTTSTRPDAARPARPSTLDALSEWQRKLFFYVLMPFVGVLAANSLYLFFFASFNGFYMAMIALHIVLGLALVLPFGIFVTAHAASAMRVRPDNKKAQVLGFTVAAMGLSTVVTGLVMLGYGATDENVVVVWSHRLLPFLAIPLYIVHRKTGVTRIAWGQGAAWGGVVGAFLLGMAWFHYVYHPDPIPPVLPPGATSAIHVKGQDFRERILELERAHAAGDMTVDQVSAEAKQAFTAVYEGAGKFFPSSATTTHGDYISADRLMGYLGDGYCKTCHTDMHKQWESSAHRFSSFNNIWYRRSVEQLQADLRRTNPDVGLRVAKWCAGCHDPVPLFSGELDRQGEHFDFKNDPTGQAGLTCVACHAIVQITDITGNASYALEDPTHYPFATSTHPALYAINKTLIYSNPEMHKRTFLKPFHRTAQFCSVCHKVSIPVAVNQFKWLRGQDHYDSWQDSGVSHNNARAFFHPPSPKVCQDCHMERVAGADPSAVAGTFKDHLFGAANTALPFIRDDEATVKRIQDFLQRDQLRVDVAALRRRRGPDNRPAGAMEFLGAPDEVVSWPLGPSLRLAAGEEVIAEVVVRTLGLGHLLTQGTVDSNEIWVEFKVTDQAGREVFHSGGIHPSTRFVDPKAHFLNALLLDRHSRAITKRNAHEIFTALYNNQIPPGAAAVVHYRFRVPADAAGGTLKLYAAVRYRKFTQAFHEFVFRGDGKEPPVLPVTTMAESTTELRYGADCTWEQAPSDDTWQRMTDYGIGLLMQGDLKGAAWAFERVTELKPDYADGWINRARVAFKEGDLDKTWDMAERAEREKPGYFKTAYFRGQVFKERGDLEQAEQDFLRVLDAFPGDHVVWGQLGVVRYYRKDYEGAIDALAGALAKLPLPDEGSAAGTPARTDGGSGGVYGSGVEADDLTARPHGTLTIDPESLDAHYNLMRCYKSLLANRDDAPPEQRAEWERRAAYHEKLHTIYKDDESAKEVAAKYRQEHPGANLESQRIHVHE